MATKHEIETMAKLVTRYFPGIKYAGCRFDERWATVDIYYHAYHAPYFLCWPYRVEVPRCNHMSLAEFRKTLIKNISKVLHMEPINPHTGRPMKPLDIDEISERAQEIIEQIPYKYLDSVTKIPKRELGSRPDFCCLDEWTNTTITNKEEEEMNIEYSIYKKHESFVISKYEGTVYIPTDNTTITNDEARLLIDFCCAPVKIIYNGPATIVFFKDGDKVVVKRQEGDYNDREKAVAMAIMKKTLGTNENKTNYLDSIKKLMKAAAKEERKQQVVKSKELIDKARAELSGRMEFTKFQAAGWLAWHDTCKKKHIGPGCEKAIATEMGYETITKFRKAKKAAQVKAKEE